MRKKTYNHASIATCVVDTDSSKDVLYKDRIPTILLETASIYLSWTNLGIVQRKGRKKEGCIILLLS